MIFVEVLTSLLVLLTEQNAIPTEKISTELDGPTGLFFPRKSGRQPSGWG